MPDNEVILKFSPYDGTRKTVFLVHGFTDSDDADWVRNSKNELLAKEDVNLISVDWRAGAKGIYNQATANTRLVGSQIYRMLNFLVAKASLNLADVRIVGHSLGAHAAGYAGHRTGVALGHITALDTAEPYFGGTDPLVRLDNTDAQHIHAIHTNGHSFGLGMSKPFAHVDVYPNGGDTQPGCRDLLGSLVGSIWDFIFLDFEGAIGHWACSHVRAVDYYVESISSPCPFVAHKCASYSDFKNGKCTTSCSAAGSCTVLGYGSEQQLDNRGTFYLNTNEAKSFCLQSVRFDSSVSQSQARTTGSVTVVMRKSNGEISAKFTVSDGQMTNGQVLNKWLEVSSKVISNPAEDKPTLTLRYTRGGLLPTTQPKFLSLDGINLYVLGEDLKFQIIRYGPITLEAGADIIHNPLQ
jgi:pancreatic triacylglycerol lipase